MGYFNPVLQYGVEAFCRRCAEVGIDGLILPDLPLEISPLFALDAEELCETSCGLENLPYHLANRK